ncbi:hypothetical protein V2A60_010327 [Cordyceps javanica]|uniref:ThiJ/PfpI n=1 Tax=Cordyceps javanica TaxID=43265 RepID=A0A545VUJ5_9HYPO|nr:ThiJ/PfpI [Cordyceps javanica]TQW05401.1 ThiJ/PfpI [Cordyceps javanica]
MAATVFGAPATTNDTKAPPPRNFGIVMYDSYDLLDIAGSVEPLYLLSSRQRLNLSLIAETLDPVYMRPAPSENYTTGSHFQLSVNPTHTFADPPEDIDVLFVPGGGGERFGNITAAVDFIRATYPKVKHLITVCTGAGVAAQAGVLDGKRATTNKWAWKEITPTGRNVQWTSPARWVVDGNIWTASGVVAGVDLILEFIETFYGRELAHTIQGATEFKRTFDPCDDPFAAWHNVTPSGDCRLTPSIYGK